METTRSGQKVSANCPPDCYDFSLKCHGIPSRHPRFRNYIRTTDYSAAFAPSSVPRECLPASAAGFIVDFRCVSPQPRRIKGRFRLQRVNEQP
jgi:hypothetical protein